MIFSIVTPIFYIPGRCRSLDKLIDLVIQVGVFETTLPTAPVADVRPLDEDITGTYTCTVTDEYYTITRGAGCQLTLLSFHTPPSRTLNVQGSILNKVRASWSLPDSLM